MSKYLVTIIFFIITINVFAIIINVPADQPTIQAGIDIAIEADTVLVQPGIYFENINYNLKNITIASLFLTTQDTSFISQTIINGNENGSVVRMENLSNVAKLIGFTLTNGSGDDLVGIDIGGALYIDNSSVECKNLIIKDNYAEQAGAIACSQSNPLFYGLLIYNNNANISSIAFGFFSTPTFVNCTIVDNTADDYCGGIICSLGSEITISNSILWNNDDCQISFYEEFSPNEASISYSNIQGGEAGIITNDNGNVNWLEGNIDNPPLFVDSLTGNYHLTINSPCIDAGDPLSPLDPDGTISDMGAFYFDQINEIDENEIELVKYNLSNYPNPFNPITTIEFSIQHDSHIELSIYNIKGQKVITLINEQMQEGIHTKIWFGVNENNKHVSSGIYFCEIKAGEKDSVKRMILLK